VFARIGINKYSCMGRYCIIGHYPPVPFLRLLSGASFCEVRSNIHGI
jgi:hypothetical protein